MRKTGDIYINYRSASRPAWMTISGCPCESKLQISPKQKRQPPPILLQTNTCPTNLQIDSSEVVILGIFAFGRRTDFVVIWEEILAIGQEGLLWFVDTRQEICVSSVDAVWDLYFSGERGTERVANWTSGNKANNGWLTVPEHSSKYCV